MKLKEKGFTLIELLATLVIVGIISSVAVVNYTNASKKENEKQYEKIVKVIEENAKLLVNENNELYKDVVNNASNKGVDENNNILNGCKFSYDLLVDNKLMDIDTVNPIDNKNFYNNNYSIIVSINDKGNYNYKLKQNANDNFIDCIQ